jgi:hypothetical protein
VRYTFQGLGEDNTNAENVRVCLLWGASCRGPGRCRSPRSNHLPVDQFRDHGRNDLCPEPAFRLKTAKNWKPLEWQGFYSFRRGIATQLTAITRDPMAAKGLLRHSSVKTTLAHYIKDVPEVTANGKAQVEQLFSELDVTGQAVQ